MRCGLLYLFSLLESDKSVHAGLQERDLFGFEKVQGSFQYEQADIDFLGFYFSNDFDPFAIPGEIARELFELSVNAFDSAVHAFISELPVESEIVSFCRRVLSAADTCKGGAEEKRLAAERAACDRTYEDALAVYNAAYKAWHEAHRMMGLLRFSKNAQGCYIARCAPDHFILPALGEYFTARFGETDWVIIDEKRGMSLNGEIGKQAKIFVTEEPSAAADGDEWEDLWRHYHKTINNESRNNPDLQRRFMPQRYWKYLPEM